MQIETIEKIKKGENTMSQEKIYVYCFKSEILRMSNGRKIHMSQGASWVDPELIKLFPNKFKPANPPEDADETPSDADNGQDDDPGDDGSGEDEKIEPDGSDETEKDLNPDDDAKVDPPDADPDPLAEALAEVADLADNKKKLETYGRKFGIELNRRKSLQNMKADLELALTELMSK